MSNISKRKLVGTEQKTNSSDQAQNNNKSESGGNKRLPFDSISRQEVAGQDPANRMSVIVEELDGLDISMSGLTTANGLRSKQMSQRKRNDVVFSGGEIGQAAGRDSNKLS